jgi:hypothetical protein
MDNASYHATVLDKAPTIQTRKTNCSKNIIHSATQIHAVTEIGERKQIEAQNFCT